VITFLKTVGAIALLVSIIPLSIWAMTGSWRHGLFALKRYAIAMAVIVVPVLVVFGITLIPGLLS